MPKTVMSDLQPSASTTSSDDSPLKPNDEMENELKKGLGGNNLRRKRKKPSLTDQDEDPYLKGICDMWLLTMEKQREHFQRSMELQQAVIQNQQEQIKALVSGLKDILKDCLKSD